MRKLDDSLRRQNIELARHWSVDHLCYRAATPESYVRLRDSFHARGTLLIESEVNGRMISTFKLNDPFLFRDQKIHLLELPAPKPNKPIAEGFEHAEVVCDVPFARLEERYAHCKINRKGLEKNFNQEWGIEFGDHALKFHHLSLESVIRLENNKKVFSALRESRVLEILKPYSPLVAGTFPLGIHTEGSDLDILLEAADLNHLNSFLKENFGAFDSFSTVRTQKQGHETLVTRFALDKIPFELLAQPVSAVEQQAYRHFLIEERLLKVGGTRFFEAARALREKGVKTEPAFAQALGLRGEPYEALLNLRLKDDRDLKNHFEIKIS